MFGALVIAGLHTLPIFFAFYVWGAREDDSDAPGVVMLLMLGVSFAYGDFWYSCLDAGAVLLATAFAASWAADRRIRAHGPSSRSDEERLVRMRGEVAPPRPLPARDRK